MQATSPLLGLFSIFALEVRSDNECLRQPWQHKQLLFRTPHLNGGSLALVLKKSEPVDDEAGTIPVAVLGALSLAVRAHAPRVSERPLRFDPAADMACKVLVDGTTPGEPKPATQPHRVSPSQQRNYGESESQKVKHQGV
jgi:hypothetical protein